MTALKIPDYRTLYFRLNPSTNYYEITPDSAPFGKIPNELKVEPTVDEKIKRNGANEIIRGRTKDHKYLFFTGLIATSHAGLFHGNHCEYVNGIKHLSLVLFQFTPDRDGLTIFFFNRYKVFPKYLQAFIRAFVDSKNGAPVGAPFTQNPISYNQTPQR